MLGQEVYFYDPMPGVRHPKTWDRFLNRCGTVLKHDPIMNRYLVRFHVSGRRCGRRKKREIWVHRDWLRKPDLIERIGSL